MLGVPATSWILTGDSLKLSFSTLTKVPFLIFEQTNPLNAPSSRAGTWAAWAEVVHQLGVSYFDEIYIYEILMKNRMIFLKVRTLRFHIGFHDILDPY